ncbi:MAG: hypothetical protein KU37_10930 [Sulfuricurvum sp. PC08-66]|nr:MAG: hypothetical protein KU37_10930 [Sulfuricurvum sp. PC08-66]
MKTATKIVATSLLTLLAFAPHATAATIEKSFVQPREVSSVSTAITSAALAQEWKILSASPTHIVVKKVYKKRTITNTKPIRHVENRVVAHIDFSGDAFSVQSSNDKAKAQLNALTDAIILNLAKVSL